MMRNLAIRFALILFFLLAIAAAAFCGQNSLQNAGRNSGILSAALENGLRVVIVRNALSPVVTTEINYLVGANESPDGFPGMAHATEHMMFRGSPGISASQISGIIAALGGSFGADTQQTVTQYYLTAPSDDLAIALHIEALRMQSLLPDDKLWDQERGAIEQEVAQGLSKSHLCFLHKASSTYVRRHSLCP